MHENNTTDAVAPQEIPPHNLIAAWEPVLKRMARRRTRCPATQDDAVQAGRLAVLRAASRFDPKRGGSFTHYAHAAARNGVSKEVQRCRRRDRLHSDHMAGVPSNEAPASLICMVREWLSTLPASLCRLFLAIYDRGHTQREIAAMLGVSQPRVAALHRELLDRARAVFTPPCLDQVN